MKTRYTLETLQEVKNASSNVRQEGDTLPLLTGALEARGEDGEYSVELINDPNFEFKMPLKDFVIQACEIAEIKLMARGQLPG